MKRIIAAAQVASSRIYSRKATTSTQPRSTEHIYRLQMLKNQGERTSLHGSYIGLPEENCRFAYQRKGRSEV